MKSGQKQGLRRDNDYGGWITGHPLTGWRPGNGHPSHWLLAMTNVLAIMARSEATEPSWCKRMSVVPVSPGRLLALVVVIGVE